MANGQTIRNGFLIKTLATMPDDAEVYVEVFLPGFGRYRAPLLTVGTLRMVNEVELAGAHQPETWSDEVES